MEHQKHSKLTKPDLGKYCSSEWAFVGTSCSVIRKVMDQIADNLSSDYSIQLVDAFHNDADQKYIHQVKEKLFQYNRPSQQNIYDDHFLCLQQDAVFVNGNHYIANSQIVFIDAEKEKSLLKRTDQLTQIQAIVIVTEDQPPFDFIQEILGSQYPETPVFSLNEIEKLTEFIASRLKNNIPKLEGIVLAGGDSVRMGNDKSRLKYHDTPQDEYLAKLIQQLELPVLISKKSNHNKSTKEFEILEDTFIGLGPFGAILTSFQKDPNTAKLVVACDLPFVDKSALVTLLENRDTSRVATCFKLKNKDFPDPLLAIYEPRAYGKMLSFLSLGYTCPRKVLINSDVKIIEIDNEEILFNANTAFDRDSAMKKLKSIKDAHLPS